MNSKPFFYRPEVCVVGVGKVKIGLWLMVIISRIFGIELSISIKAVETRRSHMKKGKFAFRLWFIKVLIESLMKSEIDEYAGKTIVARRTKKWLLEGYTITGELIESLADTHSTIAKLEKSCLDPVGGLKEKA